MSATSISFGATVIAVGDDSSLTIVTDSADADGSNIPPLTIAVKTSTGWTTGSCTVQLTQP